MLSWTSETMNRVFRIPAEVERTRISDMPVRLKGQGGGDQPCLANSGASVQITTWASVELPTFLVRQKSRIRRSIAYRKQRGKKGGKDGHLSSRASSSSDITSSRATKSVSISFLTSKSHHPSSYQPSLVRNLPPAIHIALRWGGGKGRTTGIHFCSKKDPGATSSAFGSVVAPSAKWWISSARCGAMGARM